MQATDQTHFKIGGLGRATLDLIVTVPGEVAQQVLSEFGFTTGVQIVEEKEPILRMVHELEKWAPAIAAPGEPVSNTLHALGICQESRAVDCELHWFGTVGPNAHRFRYSIDPLDSLRRVSVIPHCIGYDRRDNLALCIVSQETRQVIAIIAQANNGVDINRTQLPVMDIFVVLMLDLFRVQPPILDHILKSNSLVLIVGDVGNFQKDSFDLIADLASSGKLKWIFGRLDGLSKLPLLQAETVHPAFQDVEIICTQGPDPVLIWNPQERRFVPHDVPFGTVVTVNELGAGDAYAGGYLHSRIRNNSVLDSHLLGAACARRVLQASTARAEPENDLNVVFGRDIDRRSPSQDEGVLFDRVRLAPGITVVSGGQAGVDQTGIQAATELGIPCFCMLPRNLRTEISERLIEGTDYFGDSYIKELESPSYRYRSWLTAFLADGTLIWDFYGGEGSAATRQACHVLGRPVLDVSHLDTDGFLSTVFRWAIHHNIRVINIVGSRASRLNREQAAQVKEQTLRLLKLLAYNHAQMAITQSELMPFHSSVPARPNTTISRDVLSIGVPNSPRQRAMFESFLVEMFGSLPLHPRKLVFRLEAHGLEVVFGRSRDLPVMLREGAIDLVLCGSDMLHEEEAAFSVLLDTGLFPCFIVLVARKAQQSVSDSANGFRVGSQYPILASKLMSGTNVQGPLRSINGTSETWINVGLVDAAIDTWHTGAAADANNLELRQVFFDTSLILASQFSEPQTHPERVRDFVNKLKLWLTGGLQEDDFRSHSHPASP